MLQIEMLYLIFSTADDRSQAVYFFQQSNYYFLEIHLYKL